MLCIKKLFAAFTATLIMTIPAAHAKSDPWRIIELNGAVRAYQPMSGFQQVSMGGAIGAGAVVSTGRNGRLVLARDEQEIVVGPSSRMSLPDKTGPGMTRILQDLGTLSFKIGKRGTQHFRVETPVIVAVVKGTTFSVTAGADAHEVHVEEGAVEVSAVSGSARQLVTAGMTAYISRDEPNIIRTRTASDERFDGLKGRGNEERDFSAGDGPASDGKHALNRLPTSGGAVSGRDD